MGSHSKINSGNPVAGIKTFLIVLLSCFNIIIVYGQSYHHWGRSFNEESSLLSGNVVGGGAGPSAIYYNPATISAIENSSFSLHASLFSFDFFNTKNAFGDNIGISFSSSYVQPNFISFVNNSKKNPKWTYEIAILNKEEYRLQFKRSVDELYDILVHYPGEERYYALIDYSNRYREDWVGFGFSYRVNNRLTVGSSLFAQLKTVFYSQAIDIEAIPLDLDEYSTANYYEFNSLKFNDYRLLIQAGMHYAGDRISLGLTIRLPSLQVFSDGKNVSRKEKHTNISDPESGEPIEDMLIADFREKGDTKMKFKDPFSIAFGLNYIVEEDKKTLYTTIEFFGGVDPYKMAQAPNSPNFTGSQFYPEQELNEWLTFIHGAKPLINAGLGYKWQLREELLLMAGFRTDFNYRKDLDYESYSNLTSMNSYGTDLYHFTGGLTLNIFGQNLITGFQYSFGMENNQQQKINLSDPVEYNYNEGAALQGDRNNNMSILRNSISFYLGATLNFGGNNSESKKK